MTLPTITRGKASSSMDDMGVVTNWTLDSGVGLTSDGDNGAFTGLTASNGALENVTGSLSTTTYPFLLVRSSASSAGLNYVFKVNYTSGSSSFTVSPATTPFFSISTLALTTAKTISSFKILAGTDSAPTLDFLYVFKETLTLPSVTRPIRMRKQRYLWKGQILQREGNIVQDLGSSSPEFDVAGSFITTSQYGADVWPQVLDGLILESSTVQADGNPTWQWFSSDLYQRKVLVMDAMVEDVPGRQRNTLNDYVLRLLQWDTIGQTTGALGAVS